MLNISDNIPGVILAPRDVIPDKRTGRGGVRNH